MVARVLEVLRVEPHPLNPNSTVVRVGLDRIDAIATCVSQNLENGENRYKEGDLVLWVAPRSLVPEYLLRQGFWDDANNMGALAGPKGNRVKASKFQTVMSEGILFPVETHGGAPILRNHIEGESVRAVTKGEDVSEFMGITEWAG